MGWTTLKNGELLALASKQFEVFVTVDRNLSFEQNLPAFEIAVVVMRSRSNRLIDLQRLVPDLLASLATVQRGTVSMQGPNPVTDSVLAGASFGWNPGRGRLY